MKRVIWSILTAPMIAALLLAVCAPSPAPASVAPVTSLQPPSRRCWPSRRSWLTSPRTWPETG